MAKVFFAQSLAPPNAAFERTPPTAPDWLDAEGVTRINLDSGRLGKSAAVAVAENAAVQLVKLGGLLGLSPVAERGLGTITPPDDGHPFAGVSPLFVGLHVQRAKGSDLLLLRAAVCKTVSVGRAINGATEHDQKQGGKTMLKKLFVTAAAAAALTVPLAGVAGADPAPDNPGVPGNIPGPDSGLSPGSVISGAAKLEGSVPDVWSTAPGGYRNPGQNLKDCCLPH